MVVFSGHMFDLSGAKNPRFPAAAEPEARKLIADLVFLDELEKLGQRARFTPERHIVLPWARKKFIESSIRDFGHEHVQRFDQALATVDSINVLGEAELPADVAGFEYANVVMGGLAKLGAKLHGLDLEPLVFWNGEEGNPGGTASFVSFWRN